MGKRRQEIRTLPRLIQIEVPESDESHRLTSLDRNDADN